VYKTTLSNSMRSLNPHTLGDSRDYGFSQIVVVPSDTALAYISGQGSGKVDGDYPESFAEQVALAFDSLRKALEAIGSTPDDVVKITILSVDHTDEKLKIISDARKRFWPDQRPTSTLIPVPRLASAGMLFEIDAVAVVRDSDPSIP
ncbi:MAG: RidA family protein, partial [Cyanobacteria bacterium J06632_3]